MVCLTKWTEPSANAKLAPPGWLLRKPHWPSSWQAENLIQSGGKVALPKHAPCTAPVLSGGALSFGTWKAHAVRRRSPGQSAVELGLLGSSQGGPLNAPAALPKLNGELGGSSRNRDV